MSNEPRYTTSSMLEVMIRKEPPEEVSGFTTLQNDIRRFCDEVWHHGLQEQVESSPKRGMSGVIDRDTKLLTYVMAGRVMLTFQGKWCSVTAVAAEGEVPARMGLHGIEGTILGARNLIWKAAKAWRGGDLTMVNDSEVQIV